MVVDNIENHFDARGVKISHHSFELDDFRPRFPVARVARMRRKKTDGVVAPVIRQATIDQRFVVQMRVHRQKLDCGHAQIFQIADHFFIRDCGVSASQFLRNLPPKFCESLHVRFINHRFGKRPVRFLIIAPFECRIDNDRLRHRPRVVARIARKIFRCVADDVAEHFVRPLDPTGDRFRVRIEQ